MCMHACRVTRMTEEILNIRTYKLANITFKYVSPSADGSSEIILLINCDRVRYLKLMNAVQWLARVDILTYWYNDFWIRSHCTISTNKSTALAFGWYVGLLSITLNATWNVWSTLLLLNSYDQTNTREVGYLLGKWKSQIICN